MIDLLNTYTSTGAKLFAHEEAMHNLRNGKGQCITAHIMLTDVCQHTCAFCSVQHRAGDTLPFEDVLGFVDILLGYGLKSVILSGGGNPILYRDGIRTFGSVVDALVDRGLEIGLITNGMPLREYADNGNSRKFAISRRNSWRTVSPRVLDRLKWVRISMAGLDHEERRVYVPDIDPDKTTLGFSYVAHDIYDAPEDTAHGKVSTHADLLQLGIPSLSLKSREVNRFTDRIGDLIGEFIGYCEKYQPQYLRLLPNCLEPHLIAARCGILQAMANEVNTARKREVAFVQYKPPKAPHACYLGYIHPVLNTCGGVFPCDSCVLNADAGHKFSNPWRICHWSEVAQIYENPVKSLIADPSKTCPGCVFTRTNEILRGVVDGTADLTPPAQQPEHVNFV